MKILKFKVKDRNPIIIELNEKIAPKAVASITKLAKTGCYDNHRIERLEEILIQPRFYDRGEFGDMIEPEFKTVKENSLVQYQRYTVGMAGIENASSAGQFFISLTRIERLDGNFTVIGKVIDGFEEIQWLEKQPVLSKEASSRIYHYPQEDIIVESVTVEEI